MIATSVDIDGLHLALDTNISNHALRAALGDAYYEAGDDEANQAVRWLAAMKRVPYLSFTGTFTWWGPGDFQEYRKADLPEWLYTKFFRTIFHKYYKTRRACEEAFIAVWRQLSEAERSELWGMVS